uniref:Coiled-coil domain-containing protein 55 n=1 Tax=Tetraselmis sp. GSL018 TaxID=582737 RepID=A0A061R024_9CHLO|mmetsp:Transcript_12989/g.30815  ORF Transcript_12989/g.30815 Transcript_12989/m.30815 type:complete len:327 (-) Transcript_12989:129-1109(-)
MISGFKGVKYGLQKPASSTKAKPQTTIAAFAQDDSDDEDDVNAQVRRQQCHKAKQAKWERQRAEALEQDATVFDYDGVFDSIQAAREKPKHEDKVSRQPRYIASLMDKAKERDREQNILYERKLAKERKVEDALYGDKEKFVTSAYKKKLEEDRKWLADEKRREEIEKRNDVTKREDLGDFYRNLHRNAAFGGSRFAQVHVTKEQREAEESLKNRDSGGREPRAAESPGGASPETEGPQPRGEGEGEGERPSPQPPRPEAKPSVEAETEPRSPPRAADRTAAAPQGGEEPPPEPPAAPHAGKRRNKEDAIAAARERFLARKRAKGS